MPRFNPLPSVGVVKVAAGPGAAQGKTPMNKLIAAVISVGLAAVASPADDRKPVTEEKGTSAQEKPKLGIGDAAPPLDASRWLQGKEVKAFEPGKVYVVEFWATWCGPCIALMPDMAELQAQYRDQGVTCIGITTRDPNNTEEQATTFVKKHGARFDYWFAFADNTTTYAGWMTAAGRSGIPCSFVIDKSGRLAHIGNPIYLGVVLPLVVTGKLTAQEVHQKVDDIEQEWAVVSKTVHAGFTNGDFKPGLKALKEFEAKYPPLANNLVSLRTKLSILPKVGEFAEAKQVAEAEIDKAIRHGNASSLMIVAGWLRDGSGKESKELLAVALRASEAAVQVSGDKDASALIELAATYSAIGDKAKAKAYAQKAVTAAAGDSAESKRRIEDQARKLAE
jgi:thiol-disulfide isomerase/thioredoxin